jgi:glycosyltransferase involved in cell wall biosynthesis
MNIFWISKINNKTLHKTSRFEISEELRKRGHLVKLITERSIGEKRQHDVNNFSFPTIPGSISSGFTFGLFILFFFPIIARREKIDVIIIDVGNVWLPFILALKLLNTVLLLDIRSLPINRKESIFFKISISLSKYIVKGYTTITPDLKNVLIKKYKIKDEIIGIWTTGVSSTFLSNFSNQNNKIDYFKDPRFFYLMYHGSYLPTRGIEDLIRSITELDDSIKKIIKLLIIGIDQNKKRDLVELCSAINVTDNVEFIPPLDHSKIPLYIDLCDVGIIPLPPQNEPWWVSAPLKTLEYLARGKPIIVTNIPFHRRIFNKGKCGLLIESNSPKTLAEAITTIYKQKDDLKIIGKTGRNIVEKYYTWEKSAVELEKFIKEQV